MKMLLVNLLLVAVLARGQANGVTISMQVDNSFAVYDDGVEIGSGTDWPTTYNFDISAYTNVIAIEAINAGGPDGMVFSTSSGIISDENIRCVGVSSAAEGDSAYPGWKNEDYDDSAWPFAEVYGKIGMSPWGRRTGSEVIDDNANWIWAEEDALYALCRIQLVEPAPEPTPAPTPEIFIPITTVTVSPVTCIEEREKFAKNIRKLTDLGVELAFTEDCKFETKQCSDEECFCVKANNGKRAYGKAVVPLGESFACNKKIKRCLKARFAALLSDADYIPTCTKKGYYTTEQCNTSGTCWCVTKKKGKKTDC